ncbi:hypothetical protein [Cohnella phaseoli]|uniref:Uncharacterized protein n=1 Tax=Cohnella phaseoli TaxID=456490 RepID=A0A3D9JTT7_9BACL|nr:hypothetical protein [Cohnella phaseoli]RED77531.1 hypothetical protein DFP98_109142 [Cohnella phaseoli]
MQLSTNPGELIFHFSSVKKLSDNELVAAPLGKGIVYKKETAKDWVEISEGLTDQTHINRLQAHDDQLYACSNKGLFNCSEGKWQSAGLSLGCYQYKQFGEIGLAATVCGLWYMEDEEWRMMMRSDVTVYDFLYLPQYVVLGTNEGMSILDRMTTSWMNYKLDTAVTSLSVHRGTLIGATEHGELLTGNRRGGFDRYRMPGIFIFSIVSRGQEIFACTDRGLYRVSSIGGRISLMALKIGCQVTDVDVDERCYYMATLFEGIQCMER